MNTVYNSRRGATLSFLCKISFAVVIFILLTRLTELQIIKGAYYRDLSEGNRLRTLSITAPRGKIYARGGEILADNKEVKKTVVFDAKKGYTKQLVTGETPKDEMIQEWDRIYTTKQMVAHALGYLGSVREEEVNKPDPHCIEKGIRRGDTMVGRSGLEEQYDCVLRGIDGEELVEVDIQGNRIRTMGRKPPIPGSNINTTIDYGLQKRLSEAFGELPGAAVATDINGQILAFYSNPSFDPSVFITSNPTNDAIVRDLFNDTKLPLFNRAITGAYHPGSIFKIVTAAAALEDKKITPEFSYNDTGTVSVNGFDYTTWYFTQYGRTEGELVLSRALARSTDTFFYKVGEYVGIDRLVYWADKFGVGRKTNVDLPGEVSGLLPSPEWKQKVLNERWFLGNTYHFSIGQGDLLTTPLQANVLSATMANGGYVCEPTFIFQKTPKCVKLEIADETRDAIYQGLKEACQTGGTAYPFFDFTPPVACKTGTAETGEKSPTHAWFTVIAPAENPEIVLTVLVEKGGEGSKVAAPIARDALDYWFHVRTP